MLVSSIFLFLILALHSVLANDEPECYTNDDCDYLDEDFCNGDLIMHAEGVCANSICEADCSTVYDCNDDNYDECCGTVKVYVDHTCGSDNSHPMCVIESETVVQDCDDGLYCNGQEECADGVCVPGDSIDCSDNDLPEIATCANDPDNNPFTWDYASEFTSVCEEDTDSCTTGTYSYTHTCDVTQCCAECSVDSDCVCPSDGCVDGDWYDYPDHGLCLDDCTCDLRTCDCDHPPCQPIIYEDDERCLEPTTTTTTTTLPSTTTTTTTLPNATTTTTTTTTIPPTTTTTTPEARKIKPGASFSIRSCVLNGICDPWENPQMCPSDCNVTTTTLPEVAPTTTIPPSEAVCGNDVCEEGEDFANCPEDCLEMAPITTTTIAPSGLITGMFAGARRVHLYALAALLALIAIVLAIIRYILLPRVIPQEQKTKT